MNNYNKEAIKRYKQKNDYKKLTIETKTQYIDDIKNYCQDMGVSCTNFIIKCCNYFIQRGELPPE